ncbi:MAG: TIGR00266 family protein [Alphaproteobacteria bacterium]|nr:TIGR00266 family protein [Alphaproteobacteria bacterium]MCB9688125.1 TIGR00266 family protein [Alphaproteobacteria bacterium]
MELDVESGPSYAMAVIGLEPGESVIAEASSMVAMTPGLAVESTIQGAHGAGLGEKVVAFFVALVRRWLAKESMVVNVYRATKPGQQLMLAPAMVGDVVRVTMDGTRTVTVQAGAFLASTPGVRQKLVWGGLTMLLSGEGAFFLECSGKGELLFNAYGGLEEVAIDGRYVVDSGHVAAWEGKLTHTLRKAGSLGTAFLSGEGLVIELKGQGKVWMQTRSVGSLVSFVSPWLH